MRKKYLPLLVSLTAAALVSSAGAADSAPTAPSANGKAVFDAALSSCSSSVVKDSRGGPDRAAMDACMKAKGFTRLPGLPSGEGQRPPQQ